MATKTAKLVFCLGLALALMVAIAPAAQAISYYAYLQQYLSQPQAPRPPQPDPQPAPAPSQPARVDDFWASRAAGRKALLAQQQAPAAPPASPNPISPVDPSPAPPAGSDSAPLPSQLTAREQQMLELINRDRLAHGLQPLQADMHLTRLARLKSQDIVDNNYFDHRSPTYGTAFDMFRANGIIFIRGGENLSKAGSVQVSHLRLMNSPNHRANLLNPYFTHIGIGIVNINPSGVVVTQMFIQAP